MIDEKVLKKSKYSFFIEKEDGSYIIFNSLTGVIISVYSQENLKELETLLASEEIQYDEESEMISCFYENGILVGKPKNEFEFVKYCFERDVVKDSTLALTLITTRQCNLRCIYCYEDHLDKPMTKEVYDSILKFIEKSIENRRYSAVNINLFGGEPFVEYKKVVEFLTAAKAICDENNVPFHVSATTNGALIFPERFEVLASLNCRNYQITIDGFGDTHDKYRKSRDEKGSFNRIIENLKYMNSTKYNFKVIIRTNFNEEVFARAEEFYTFIKNTFDDRFCVYYEGIKRLGGKNDDNLEIVEGSDITTSTVNIAKVVKNLNLKNDVVDMMTRPFSRVCYATKHNNFLIDYDGSILKCTLSLDDELNRMGHIESDGTFELDEDKHANWVGKKTHLNEECHECKILPICYGGRCVNGLVHGNKNKCDSKSQEKEVELLIAEYV